MISNVVPTKSQQKPKLIEKKIKDEKEIVNGTQKETETVSSGNNLTNDKFGSYYMTWVNIFAVIFIAAYLILQRIN